MVDTYPIDILIITWPPTDGLHTKIGFALFHDWKRIAKNIFAGGRFSVSFAGYRAEVLMPFIFSGNPHFPKI